MTQFQICSFLLAAWAALFCLGCGGTSRLPISGAVTVDGQPVTDGYIEFRPLPGTSSPTAGSPIVDGHYEVASEKGLLSGDFQVQIRAMRASDKTVYDPVTGEPYQGREQFLPARYNDESTLTAEVNGSQLQFDFDLKTEP